VIGFSFRSSADSVAVALDALAACTRLILKSCDVQIVILHPLVRRSLPSVTVRTLHDLKTGSKVGSRVDIEVDLKRINYSTRVSK
jgi:hypothetical protein